MARQGSPPNGWQDVFIEHLAKVCNVRNACRKADVSHMTAYRERKRNAEFREAWDEALSVAVRCVMEPEAMRRAINGVRRPVWHKGEKVGYETVYSDRLLQFLLQAHGGEKYRSRIEVGGMGGGPLEISQLPENMSNEDFERYNILTASGAAAGLFPHMGDGEAGPIELPNQAEDSSPGDREEGSEQGD